MIFTSKTFRLLTLPLAVSALVACATPEEKPLQTTSNAVVAYADGTPGGVIAATEELVATVTAVNKSKCTFVVKDEAGNQRTVQAPPEMVNFDQLAVGDKIRAMIATETVVYVQEPGAPAPDAAAGVGGVAEPGQKPAMAVIEQARITAKVVAVNVEKHTATLKFEDGSQREVAVRPDVKISDKYIGKEVVIQITAALAAGVEKQ